MNVWNNFTNVLFYSYTMAHIWACPPSEGDDYIFHCHPVDQKIPKPKRLQEWYKKMLDKGMVERIVLDYKVSLCYQNFNYFDKFPKILSLKTYPEPKIYFLKRQISLSVPSLQFF